MSGQAGRYQRSATGMIGAMVVLLVVVVGFVVLRDLNRREPPSPVEAVDYQPTLRYARANADFAVLAPDRLPAGWKATTVEFVPEPSRWHLGVLTDQGRYVGLEQAFRTPRSMVRTYVDSAPSQGGQVVVAGQRWRTWTDADGDTALVRRQGPVTTLVVGSVGRDVLVDYVASLS